MLKAVGATVAAKQLQANHIIARLHFMERGALH